VVEEKSIMTFAGVTSALVSAFGFWGSAAFSPSVFLTFLSLPLAIYSGIFGAHKSAAVAVYFGVTAWVPHWVPRDSAFNFGGGWFAMFGLGVALAIILGVIHVFYSRAT